MDKKKEHTNLDRRITIDHLINGYHPSRHCYSHLYPIPGISLSKEEWIEADKELVSWVRSMTSYKSMNP